VSRFYGVEQAKKRFRAGVWHENEHIRIGAYATAVEAAEAVDRLLLHLGRPPRNFPEKKLRAMSLEELRAKNPPEKRPSPSKYVGVGYDPEYRPSRPWIFVLTVRGRSVHVGGFASEYEAAIARDRAALHYYDEPELNFPEDARRLGPADLETIRAEIHAERKKHTVSRYRGVILNNGRWSAKIYYDSASHFLGCFDTEEEAALAYDEVARRVRGAKAKLNFPAD
jgi:hypothetical protein